MNYNNLEQEFSETQIKAIDHILNNVHYDLWVYTVLYQLSAEVIKEVKEWKHNNNCHYVPSKVKSDCPHCGINTNLRVDSRKADYVIGILVGQLYCYNCENKSTLIALNPHNENNNLRDFKELWISPPPKNDLANAPLEVEETLRQDYKEAHLCSQISPRASVALSRYCLQKIIKEKTDITSTNLNRAINELLEKIYSLVVFLT